MNAKQQEWRSDLSEIRIQDMALLSDCHTAALVTRHGSVVWYCPAHFEAPSVFAQVLDPEGGHWSVHPSQPADVTRRYLDNTLVLETTFHTPGGTATLTDALALGKGEREHAIGTNTPHMLVRQVRGVAGAVTFNMQLNPRPDYAQAIPYIHPTERGAVIFGGPAELHLLTDCPLEIGAADVRASFTVHPGEVVNLALVYRQLFSRTTAPPAVDVGKEIANTVEGWRSWMSIHHCYQEDHLPQVRLSALVLQALTFQKTGAVIAAPTMSLPEIIGEDKNWDYRYVWLRDLSLTLQAMGAAICTHEVDRLLNWVERIIGNLALDKNPLQPMFSIHGERLLTEYELDHLSGYRNSRPVRVGNEAWQQEQSDVLGEVVDAIYSFRDEVAFDDTTTNLVISLANRAADKWCEGDSGIWELRHDERQYTSSKLFCWVALDRAIKLAPSLGPGADVDRWQATKEEIRETILQHGWSKQAGAYAGILGSDELDASVLLMPLVGFLPATDPRMRATIETINRELTTNGLVCRWAEEPNAFFLCTYWLVECLALAGEVERATELFERTTAHANDLGLLSEMVEPHTGELVGNFPQGFSHIGLINAARRLNAVRETRNSCHG